MTLPPFDVEPGAEVDCAYYVSPDRYVRGFLRVPSLTQGGSLRLTEHVPNLTDFGDVLDPIPIILLDGGSGTPGCLLSCFVSRHQITFPTPAPFPLELFVNEAIIGIDEPERAVGRAAIQSSGLSAFFGSSHQTIEQAAARGFDSVERAVVAGPDYTLTLNELVSAQEDGPSIVMTWSGELILEGDARPLQDWSGPLHRHLVLFAFLLDQPLAPNRIYAEIDGTQTDHYAAWGKRMAPVKTAPLATLDHIADRLDSVVGGWQRLNDEASAFLDHVVWFQLYRKRQLLSDQVLWLIRCLELYHAYSARFVSVVRPKKEQRAFSKQVVESLPDDLRDQHGEWIRSTLAEANRKRLVMQITDVLEDLGLDAVQSCRVADVSDFASLAKRTRNYYTHPSSVLPDDVPRGRDLHILVQRLWFIVRGCVLVELGLTRDETSAALSRSAQKYLLA